MPCLNHVEPVRSFLASTLTITGVIVMGAGPVLAQITPDATLGSESSVVTPDALVNGAQADLIEGGALRGANVFHSFHDFNVNDGQRVYFANPTGIENILSRVTGGNVSNILGTLGVDGAANLFLLNPNGVVFGPNAQLDVSGAFTVTTAERYSFLDGTDFSATNPGQAPLVTVNITPGVQFGPNPSVAVVNQADLAVGQDLSIAAGSVDSSTGSLTSGGQVSVEGVNGDVQIRDVTANSALLSASGNLELTDSQIATTNDLNLQAQDTVVVRDSVTTPVSITSGGDLTILGEQGIDILALNHLDPTPFIAGGSLTLVSDGVISADSHFASGNGFSVLNLAGQPGQFISLYDPIISATGNVLFAGYTGTSLKVEATGSITASGDITINGPDTNIDTSCMTVDCNTLRSHSALILRSGVTLAHGAIANGTVNDTPPQSATVDGGVFNLGGTANGINVQSIDIAVANCIKT